MKIAVPSSKERVLEVGAIVRVHTDPYDNPLPVDGTIIGVRVTRKQRANSRSDLYDIVFRLETSDDVVREFDFEESFLEERSPGDAAHGVAEEKLSDGSAPLTVEEQTNARPLIYDAANRPSAEPGVSVDKFEAKPPTASQQQELRSSALLSLGALSAIGAFVFILILIAGYTGFDASFDRHSNQEDIRSLVDLAKALVWPISLLVLLALFQVPLRSFLAKLNKLTFKIGEAETTLEAQVEQTQRDVTELVVKAEAASSSNAPSQVVKEIQADQTFSSARHTITPETLPLFARSRILWVDDRPENNLYLIQAFRELNIAVDLAKSSDEALQLYSSHHYDVIITDMGRPPDNRAGYTLLHELRERGTHPPVIIYAGSDLPEHRQMAIENGAIESTNRPQTVFNLVTRIIARKAGANA